MSAAEEDVSPSYHLFFVLCLHLKFVILRVRDSLHSAMQTVQHSSVPIPLNGLQVHKAFQKIVSPLLIIPFEICWAGVLEMQHSQSSSTVTGKIWKGFLMTLPYYMETSVEKAMHLQEPLSLSPRSQIL